MTDEGDKGGAADGLESDATGYIYSTNYEHNSVLRRHRNGEEWETVVHDPRLLWHDTLCSRGWIPLRYGQPVASPGTLPKRTRFTP